MLDSRKDFVKITPVPRQAKDTPASVIPERQVFTGKIGGYTNCLFIKIDKLVYPLDAPVGDINYWNDVYSVTNYNPVVFIDVTVEEL